MPSGRATDDVRAVVPGWAAADRAAVRRWPAFVGGLWQSVHAEPEPDPS